MAEEEFQDQGHVADRCIMVIFGASGDLTTRKLLPALYNLLRNKLLPQEFAIIGFAKDELSEEQFRQNARKALSEYAGAPDNCDQCDWLAGRACYSKGGFQ